MRARAFAHPIVWSDEDLARDRAMAEQRFVDALLGTGTELYAQHYQALRPYVRSALEHTRNLSQLEEAMPHLSAHEVEALRFMCAPPLSVDNAKTVAAARSTIDGMTPREALLEAIMSMLDPFRFPWVPKGRDPLPAEKDFAISWTSSLWAIQKTQTESRIMSSREQEATVRHILHERGFALDDGTNEVVLPDDVPRASYRHETLVAGQKCDVPLRLPDGRLMLIECKVSNSAVNSTKRLIREVCGKIPAWRAHFGKEVITAVVLDGVISLKNLKDAQNAHGASLFWGFRLDDLGKFLDACKADAGD